MSDVNLFIGVSAFDLILQVIIYFWPVTLIALGIIGAIGYRFRRYPLGMTGMFVATLGVIALAGFHAL